MGHSPPWNKITSKKYSFNGQFNPVKLYEETKAYLEKKQYDLAESELEFKNLPNEVDIFTHIIADLELTRRHYIKIAFSIKMGGKIVDKENGIVDGNLVLHVNGFIQQHSLLHEHHETFMTKLMTKFYDKFIDPDAFGNAIVGLIIEMGKLMAEVKSKLNRR